jgi:pfkB family carbohydrate kinase
VYCQTSARELTSPGAGLPNARSDPHDQTADMAARSELDVITIGRASVDLYGQQIGGRLEDMASFAKSVGGSPTNMAIGASRLGLRAGLITRVGDEHMGRFIREQLERDGVDTRGVVTDQQRLTALVLLGVRDDRTFPLIFVRENCADAALDEGDIDPAYIARAAAIVVTGTHFSRANLDAASRKAIRLARAAGRKVAFDIDYRPNLWGLAGHGAGEERFIASDRVTEHLQSILGAYRRRLAGHAGRDPRDPRALGRDHRVQARADGLRGVSRRNSRFARGWRARPRLSGRGLQRPGCG